MSHAQKKHFEQPKEFKFTAENMKKVEAAIAKYPKGRQASAVMPLLDIAQRQNDNWIPEAAMEEIGRILDMPRIKVFEVATFYTMYNLEPRGKHHIQFCTTTPCWLAGSGEVVQACEDPQQRRLAGAAAAEDGDELTLFDVEVEAIEDSLITECLAGFADAYRQSRHRVASFRVPPRGAGFSRRRVPGPTCRHGISTRSSSLTVKSASRPQTA